MKKVLFLQNEGNVIGGVWYVNKTIGEELIKNGYDVSILSIRNNPNAVKLDCSEKLKIMVVNDKLPWEIMRKKSIIKPLKEFNFIRFIKNFFRYFKDQYYLNSDYKMMKAMIRKINPDYIIASQYMTLRGIPYEYLKRTVHEQHSSVDAMCEVKNNYKTLISYNNKLFGYLWLSKTASIDAKEKGFKNNYYIYNPIRFTTDKIADVVSNKKLVVISRIEEAQKRIGLMIYIVNEVLKDYRFKDWKFDIYGVGEFTLESKKILAENARIRYHGKTDDPMGVLLNSSINLNTSSFEGFSLSILEASMCGVPTITFNFGESVYEEVSTETGIVIENDDVDLYINSLSKLMLDLEKLEQLSNNCKKFSINFLPENIVLDWIELFNKMDKE